MNKVENVFSGFVLLFILGVIKFKHTYQLALEGFGVGGRLKVAEASGLSSPCVLLLGRRWLIGNLYLGLM